MTQTTTTPHITHVRQALLDTLADLRNREQPMDIERAKAVASVASVLVDTAKVFCASLADVFDNEVDPQWRADLFALIEATPNLDWLLLTKRVGNVPSMAPTQWLASSLRGRNGAVVHAYGWPDHVWLGATICNQEEADRDIPKLVLIPAAKRFLSMEPLLGAVDLTHWVGLQRAIGATTYVDDNDVLRCDLTGTPIAGIDWVIVGGESGPNARPMHPDWARSLRDQCQAAGVPYLFKQWGNYVPHIWFDGPDSESDECFDDFLDLERTRHQFLAADGRTWDTNNGRYMYPPLPLGNWCLMADVGKKAAGRLLDGREWNGVPT